MGSPPHFPEASTVVLNPLSDVCARSICRFRSRASSATTQPSTGRTLRQIQLEAHRAGSPRLTIVCAATRHLSAPQKVMARLIGRKEVACSWSINTHVQCMDLLVGIPSDPKSSAELREVNEAHEGEHSLGRSPYRGHQL